MSESKRRMSLSAWGHISEIVGAVGVIVGFFFLSRDVRENTEITRASAYDQSIDELNQWRSNVIRDPDVSRLYLAYSNGTTEDLEPEDQFRLQVLLTSLWGVYETAYYSRDYGLLGQSEWSRFETQMCDHRGLNRPAWDLIVRPRVTEQFAHYVQSTCGP